MIAVLVIVIGGVLLAALGAVATFGIGVGLLGIGRMVRFTRCDACGHLGLTSMREPLRSCTYCRHGRLMHPLATLHHPIHHPAVDHLPHRGHGARL